MPCLLSVDYDCGRSVYVQVRLHFVFDYALVEGGVVWVTGIRLSPSPLFPLLALPIFSVNSGILGLVRGCVMTTIRFRCVFV